MAESVAIVKHTGAKTLHEVILWYVSGISKQQHDDEILEILGFKNKTLFFSVASPNRTIKIIAVIVQLLFSVEHIKRDAIQRLFNNNIKFFARLQQLIIRRGGI